jgi:hypothetical protein
MDRSNRSRVCAAFALLLAMLTACGGGDSKGAKDGACVFTLKTDVTYALCEDGYETAECTGDANYNATFSSGATCASMGYTLTCPGDPAGMLRKVCPGA